MQSACALWAAGRMLTEPPCYRACSALLLSCSDYLGFAPLLAAPMLSRKAQSEHAVAHVHRCKDVADEIVIGADSQGTLPQKASKACADINIGLRN